MLEINPVLYSINSVDLEERVCKALPLTGAKVNSDDLGACQRMKNKDKMIIKFKNKKQKNDIIFKQKELKSKGDDLLALQLQKWILSKIDHSCDLENLLEIVNTFNSFLLSFRFTKPSAIVLSAKQI